MTDMREAADHLQAVPLEDFVAERKRLAKELRDGGDRVAAAALAKLPKPSPPAWALNQLARANPELVAGWIATAEALRDASANAGKGGGDALRSAMTAHREATRGVLTAARDRTRPNGRELSEPMLDRVRDLLQLATLDPEESDRLRAGVIVEGGEDEIALPEPPEREEERPRPQRQSPAQDRAAERRAEREREREAAARAELEQLVARAGERLEELRATVAECTAAAANADERVEEARRTLHRSESEAGAAHEAVGEAADAAEQAERELAKLTAKLSA
jgi:hypothetical protein